jgi:hypothetical protein
MAEQERFSQRGWDIIRLTSENLVVELIPELGGTICSIRRRADDLELLHRTPWGLPRYGGPQLGGTAEVIRNDANPGGWQSLFPNGGDTVVVHGSDQGYDGEARIAPFEVVEDAAGEDGDQLTLHVPRLRRSPMTMTKIIKLSGDSVSITETVRNVGAAEREVMWGSQLQFGAPLIGEGTEIDCAANLVHPDATILYDVDYEDVTPWPRTPGPKSTMINLRYLPEPGPDSNRLAYLTDFERGTASITNTALGCQVTIDWDVEQWPHLWYRLEAGGDADFPWFGKGWFLALTPNSSWPAHGLHDARRIGSSTLKIQPDEERCSTVSLRVGTPS